MSGHEIFEDTDEDGDPTASNVKRIGDIGDCECFNVHRPGCPKGPLTSAMRGVSVSEVAEGLSKFAKGVQGEPRVTIGEPVKVDLPPREPGPGLDTMIRQAITAATEDVDSTSDRIRQLTARKAALTTYIDELNKLRERFCPYDTD